MFVSSLQFARGVFDSHKQFLGVRLAFLVATDDLILKLPHLFVHGLDGYYKGSTTDFWHVGLVWLMDVRRLLRERNAANDGVACQIVECALEGIDAHVPGLALDLIVVGLALLVPVGALELQRFGDFRARNVSMTLLYPAS